MVKYFSSIFFSKYFSLYQKSSAWADISSKNHLKNVTTIWKATVYNYSRDR